MKLGIPGELANGPAGPDEVVRRVVADSDVVYRLMRALGSG